MAAPGVLANDTDVENNPLTAIQVSPPAHGILSLNANGSFTYTPVANYNGTDSFTYKANDGTSDSGVATVNLTLTPVNDQPTLNAISNVTINEDAGTQTVNLSGISAGGGETQTLTVTASSSNTALIPNPTVNYTSPNSTGTLVFAPVAGANGTATVTVRVQDNGGTANGGIDTISRSFLVTVNPTASTAATFVTTDTTTQGNWVAMYGSDGYNIINQTVNYPSYASVNPTGKSDYTWAASTTDVRALQKPATIPTDRIAACWYASPSFSVDLNLTDGLAHRVALYCLDWDAAGRAQTIDILDASSSTVLSSQNVTSFNGGQYLVWDVKGHIIIRLTQTGSYNAVLSGLFFGVSGTPPPPSSASFVAKNTATQGNWKGVYGADGYNIINQSAAYPSYASVNPIGKSDYTWAASTADARALQKPASTTDRIAACWYASPSFSVDLNLIDGLTHRVALYCLDWDTTTRAQTIQILDASNNTLLNSQTMTSFNGGQYLLWNINGHVIIKFTQTGAYNAVLSGVFFDAASAPLSVQNNVHSSSGPLSPVSILSARFSNGRFEIDLRSDLQQSYDVEASTDMITWDRLPNSITGGRLVDGDASKFQQRFYRFMPSNRRLGQSSESQ